jgi:hypothetical protein
VTGTSRRRVLAVQALAVTAFSLAGCVAPPHDDSAFRGDARTALESATSDTRTAELALRHWLGGDVTKPYADVVVTDAEGALGPVADVFAGLDPPTPAADRLRQQVLDLLADAQAATEDGRIALRRSDAGGVRSALDELDRVGTSLESAGEALR